MVPAITALAQQAALGAPGGGSALGPLAALANSAAGANRMFRNPGVVAGAASAIGGSLQNAYGNPAQEAFLTMAGVGYWEQRAGFRNPATLAKLWSQAQRMYPNPIDRDMALRSMFGLSGADLIEAYGAHGAAALHQAQHAAHRRPDMGAFGHALQHPQGATTPEHLLNRGRGGIEAWALGNPVLAATLGIGGYQALKRGPGAAARLLRRLGTRPGSRAGGASLEELLAGAGERQMLAAGAGDVAAGAGGAVAGDVLGALARVAAGGAAGGLAGMAEAMLFPDSAGLPALHGDAKTRADRAAEARAVRALLIEGHRRFGSRWTSRQAQQWMRKQLSNPRSSYYSMTRGSNGDMFDSPHPYAAGQLLNRALAQIAGTGAHAAVAGQAPEDTFKQSVDRFSGAIDKFLRNRAGGTRNASFGGSGVGGMLPTSMMGAPAASALGLSAPGMELAAFTGALGGGGGSPGAGGGAQPASYTTPSGSPGGSVAPSGGGTYSIDGLVGLALNAGFQGDNAAIAAAVAMAESGGDPKQVSTVGNHPVGSRDRGLWQFNSYWNSDVSDACAFSPGCAAGAALRTYRQRGWKDWVTYTNGAYRQYIDAARQALARRKGGQGSQKRKAGGVGGGSSAGHRAGSGGGRSAPGSVVGAGGPFGGNPSIKSPHHATAADATHIHVHIDGREIQRYRLLTRGA